MTAVTLAAAVAASSAVLLAGCGSSAQQGAGQVADPSMDRIAADPLTAVRQAADVTGHIGTLSTATTLHTESAQKQMTLRGTGVYNYTTRIGRLEVTVPPGSGGTTGKLTEVFEPGTVYMQGSGAKVPDGKWVKVQVQQLGDGNLVSSGATDPASASGALRGAQTARLVDTDHRADGTVLRHFTGTLDLAEAAKATGGGQATGLSVGARTFTVKQVPYDVWLDQHGRIRKVVETFTFAQVPGSTKAKDQVKVTSTSEFSNFGQPVAVSAPPAGDVYSAGAATPSK